MTQPAGLLVCALLVAMAACARPPLLVAGPVELMPQPAIFRFVQPQRAPGQSWEMCFEFDVPRESYAAGRIIVILVAGNGARYKLENLDLDRRGEAVVCQLGRLAALNPATANRADATLVFEAAELSAPASLRLHGIRGEARP